jgi:hypothetical protein
MKSTEAVEILRFSQILVATLDMRYLDGYRLRVTRPNVLSLLPGKEKRFCVFQNIQNVLVSTNSPVEWVGGSFQGRKAAGIETACSPPSAAESRMRWMYTFTPHVTSQAGTSFPFIDNYIFFPKL